MQLLSVNIGSEQPLVAKKSGKTGIFKQPTDHPVLIGTLGLAGDTICDTHNHGGVDQAVYVYGAADYAWWSAQLGLGSPLAPGTFGENLTISDLESAEFAVGDRLIVGKVTLEVTAPRVPCVTLAVRMGDPDFIQRYRDAERPGLYCRVIETGAVQAGDPVTVERYVGDRIGIVELFRQFYQKNITDDRMTRLLAVPIDIRSRRHYEAILRRRGEG